jgi:hypothetical protein
MKLTPRQKNLLRALRRIKKPVSRKVIVTAALAVSFGSYEQIDKALSQLIVAGKATEIDRRMQPIKTEE